MSWRVTISDSTAPCSERMGVEFISAVTLRPSGTSVTISSARNISPERSASTTGNSRSETTRPSARLKDTTLRRPSGDCWGSRRLSTILWASQLKDFGAPVTALKTTTATE